MSEERVLAEFDDLRQVGDSRLRVRVVQSGASRDPRIDIREYVKSAAFTGWTRRGIRLTAEEFEELLSQAPAIRKVLR
jgi:hypothetical protein